MNQLSIQQQTFLNLEDVQRYLEFLDTDAEVFNYALFAPSGGSPIKGYGVCFGTKLEILTLLPTLEFPFSLHVTLNRTSLSGRKNKDIESCRVLCCDIDRELSNDDVLDIINSTGTHLVVRSSPGKYHFYWKLREEVSLAVWSSLQRGIAWLLDGDLALSSISHLIRVPGVSRITKLGESFLPSIVFAVGEDDIGSLSIEELYIKIDGLREAQDESEVAREKEVRKLSKETLRLSSLILENNMQGLGLSLESEDFASLAVCAQRNETLFSLVKSLCFSFDGTQDELASFALLVGRQFNEELGKVNPKGALKEEELLATVESALKFAIGSREKQQERREVFRIENAEKVKDMQISMQANGFHDVEVESNGLMVVEAVDGVPALGQLGKFSYDLQTHQLRISRFSEPALIERILQRFGNELIKVCGVLYAYESQKHIWVEQEGKHTSVLRVMVLACIDDMTAEDEFAVFFATTKDGLDAKKLELEINKWKSSYRISGLIGALRDSNGIHSTLESPFDTNPMLYHCANGVLELSSGEIREAVCADYLLRRSDVQYLPAAGFSWWSSFLLEIFSENEEPEVLVNFMQEVFGYSLTGKIDEQMIFIHYGGGANGKSRVLSALARLQGSYCGRLQPDALGVKRNSIAKTMERIAVRSECKRTLVIDDLDSGMEWSEGLVKSLTEKVLVARKLYQEEREISNSCKIHVGCNEVPRVENSSHAVYRRLAIVEYARRFAVDPRKYQQIEKSIQNELSGILNWALQGLCRVMERGRIAYPAEVLAAVEEYQEQNSTVESLIKDIFEIPSREECQENNANFKGQWLTVREITGLLDGQKSFSVGQSGRSDATKIGVTLSSMGCVKRRRHAKGERCTQYCVIPRQTLSAAEQSL